MLQFVNGHMKKIFGISYLNQHLQQNDNETSNKKWRMFKSFVSWTILVLLLLKEVGSARLRESDVHPISPKTTAPQYQPIDRKKRKGKRVEDYSRDRAA